ncbi:ABC transporter permease [Spirulina major CS-329]|uniref:ABC transporter permease n=1 Tax=Spirulina TaxID=1154 RepID=UPI00232DAB59|nr:MULTISPECIES: ABC transporter permease [Spirulina]MDB9494432.1 ABC transporter permease [Spirulina subsalsa CS-330]MDB9501559.1 ABC transporter permease [Spirulina major CS-329]
MALSPHNLLIVTLNALRGNPIRSALTTVGIFMGVLAVNGTLQVQTISKGIIERQLNAQIAPQLFTWIHPGITSREQAQAIARLGGVIDSASSTWGSFDTVQRNGQETFVITLPVSPNFPQVNRLEIVAGRFFTPQEMQDFRQVGVLAQDAAMILFPDQDPIGQSLLVRGNTYRIVGVIAMKPFEQDEQTWSTLFVPLSLAHARTGQERITSFSLRPTDWRDLDAQQAKLQQILATQFPDRDPYVEHNAEAIAEQQDILILISRGLLGVGLVALVISGVGIANITFASVIERTPEIGLRRAIGATQGDILWQFLLEAVILSMIGGMSAIAVVDGTTRIVAATFDLPYTFQLETAAMSLGIAIVVGAGSSFVPARRASRIEPMSALRSE